MRLIVAGGRDFNDYPLLERKLDALLRNRQPDCIISGKAKGADTLGERYAHARSIPVECYPADWAKYGKSAGYKRNQLMAENATHLVAFWDGQSRGTRHMIDIAEKQGLDYRVIKY